MGKRINEEKERALRDTDATATEIAGLFGGEVAMLVDGLQRDEKAARFYWVMKTTYKEVFVEG